MVEVAVTELIPVVSDIQYPLHDKRAVDLAATIIEDIGVDAVCVGDELDNWQISRWCRGRKGEYDGQLGTARDGIGGVLKDLRVTHVSRSNHGNTRLENYLEAHAPALADLPELTYENFMRFPELGIEFHREPYRVAPGWLMVHGDEGSLIKSPGGTALNIAKNFGSSIVCGHTHKMGVQHAHINYGGRTIREMWGFEVGNLMDQRKAEYLKGGHGNWQQGIGVLVVDGSRVTPVPVPFRNGVAYFNGKRYSV
jgi:hypothetical protein